MDSDLHILDGITNDEKELLLETARESIISRFTGKLVSEPETPEGLLKKLKTGVFVTLKKEGSLRGCIGCMDSNQPLMETVREYARSAAFGDPRFHAVKIRELDQLEIEISVLTPMVPVEQDSEEIPKVNRIVAGEHGVHLEYAGRHAVFLPQVATEQGWNIEQLLSNLSTKAGLPGDSWKQPGAVIKIFKALVFSESDF